ncbi:MAG: hypothetical protein ACLFRP_08950 [Puniceicoccaceae bacterium]
MLTGFFRALFRRKKKGRSGSSARSSAGGAGESAPVSGEPGSRGAGRRRRSHGRRESGAEARANLHPVIEKTEPDGPVVKPELAIRYSRPSARAAKREAVEKSGNADSGPEEEPSARRKSGRRRRRGPRPEEKTAPAPSSPPAKSLRPVVAERAPVSKPPEKDVNMRCSRGSVRDMRNAPGKKSRRRRGGSASASQGDAG